MAVAFVSSTAVSKAAGSTDVTTLTPAISGVNTILFGSSIVKNQFHNVTAAEYGGEAMTPLLAQLGSSNSYIESYYMLNPTAGGNLEFSYDSSGSTNLTCLAAVFSGVDQVTPFSITKSDLMASGDWDQTLVSAVNEMTYDIVGDGWTGGVPDWTADVGQTEGASAGGGLAWGGQSYEAGAASVTMGWSGTGGPGGYIAVSMRAASAGRSRAIKYFHDINDPGGRIYNDLGRVVPPWELKPNNWIRVTGLFLPTSTKYKSFTQDPELAYIEEVSFSARGLRIKTNRGEMTEVLLARAAGGKTL